MDKDSRPEAPQVLDDDLRQALEAIREEEVPDRLLDLARLLQARLRGEAGEPG